MRGGRAVSHRCDPRSPLRQVEVECNGKKGRLNTQTLMVVTHSPARSSLPGFRATTEPSVDTTSADISLRGQVAENGQQMSGTAFEDHCGFGSKKKWKTSIKVAGTQQTVWLALATVAHSDPPTFFDSPDPLSPYATTGRELLGCSRAGRIPCKKGAQ